MREVKLINLTHPFRVPLFAGYCTSFLCQLRGLTFRRSLPENWGLLLVQRKDSRVDASIHMFMMQMDLAIIWINSRFKIVDVRPAYRWRSILVPREPAKYILELPIERLGDFKIGDEVRIEEISARP